MGLEFNAMVDPAIQSELLSLLGELPLMQQKQALNYVRSIKTDSAAVSEAPETRLPPGTPSYKLLKFMGRMSEEDARLMQEAIAECERIDANEW
jgi:hypothetical protein